ncbi:MAG: SoxR reducing system RseC family protein [Flavobacteriaceae bacterium]|nr:SoxR reducing system RseC family protein [Eudoraea sp.]MBT8311599.1 SoxR reducing system RseC family protein [Eudoraea sp.]NNJ38001.1 SoxR reducing system RseC family protein [Flavobacteriaceae bacterium]NNJ39775.1 SoxR reducing system RseC family protein [Eudoraea sp.]
MDFKPKETNAFIHSGVVSEIHGRSIIVSLDKDVHCESCSAKGACGVSDSTTKEVEIIDSQESFALNEPVKVILKKDLGQKAVFWAYIFPFLLMLLTLVTASLFFAEWIAGLLALLILIPYYTAVYAFKNYFRKTFRISILRI